MKGKEREADRALHPGLLPSGDEPKLHMHCLKVVRGRQALTNQLVEEGKLREEALAAPNLSLFM